MPMFQVILEERITFERVTLKAIDAEDAEAKVHAYWYDETVRNDTPHFTCDTTSLEFDTAEVQAEYPA